MKKVLICIIALVVLFAPRTRADEGMWIPILLGKNIDQMQQMGCKLTLQDIYDVNNASLKDAIVIFGNGCTGELISDEGLLITNHHCGFGNIQEHSTVEHDYLTNGFWAMNRQEELPNPGLSVTFLVRMEDVTEKVLNGVTDAMTDAERKKIIDANINTIEKATKANTHYDVSIRPFFSGNEYYMFVNEIFKDVRLVGAPPSAIGNFGGDTDNWMWPRHTGDFSMFRIYADKDNKPAAYSPDNVPYKPKKSLSISIKGVQEGDFTMVFGYPGRTQQYLPSYAVKMIGDVQNPHKVNIRQHRLDVMRKYMNASAAVRIQYADKYAGTANAWKKWSGESKGLKRMDAVGKKQKFETEFADWVAQEPSRQDNYGHILGEYERIYTQTTPYELASDYVFEAMFNIEIVRSARRLRDIMQLGDNPSDSALQVEVKKLKTWAGDFYKDYYAPIDRDIMVEMLQLYAKNVDVKFHPSVFATINQKFKGDYAAYTDHVFAKSVLADKTKFLAFLDNYSYKKLLKDPAVQLYQSVAEMYFQQIAPVTDKNDAELEILNRLYVKAVREMNPNKNFYPDANFTLRVTYGKVAGYDATDGVFYRHYTTLDGIIQKDNPDIYDYRVPEKLKQLYRDKDYGQYAENGVMHVAFTAMNHTTGGNSGSPVLDAQGRLVGINFDRCWEGTMSDIMYDPLKCRNISLDIRYALFVIDKFAGAKHLIDEMKIVNN